MAHRSTTAIIAPISLTILPRFVMRLRIVSVNFFSESFFTLSASSTTYALLALSYGSFLKFLERRFLAICEV
jgi:hypothetical protein